MGKVNDDIQRERDKCTFNVQELTALIDGGAEQRRIRKILEEVFISSATRDEVPEEYLSYKEKYERGIKQTVAVFRALYSLIEQGKISMSDISIQVGRFLGTGAAVDGSAAGLHFIAFIPSIISQGNDDQAADWVGRAWNCNIIGSYAQTELGHGTFIRGLETTATYDPSTKEFVLHSPTLTSYKWWPGGLGQTVNYCVVVAQLYTKGECHGIHSFVVQVRDEETHMPLPGIKIGDIGPKMGLNAVNNGFLGFNNVRIPRDQMLMKHAQVLEDGTYVKSKNSKLNYGAMVYVRVLIVYDVAKYLIQASIIATRFSVVRRQSQLKEGEPEVQILDFVTQQHKIFIGIASAHAFRVNGNRLWETFHRVSAQLAKGDLNRLPELHALACCLKAVSTSDVANAVERCRLACGGHGYMQSSKLPVMYGLATAACTYEGENTVLLLQTARFLVKSWQQIGSAALTPTIAYLEEANAKGFVDRWENSVEGIIRGFKVVATRKISSCVDNMQKRVAMGMAVEDAWNLTSIQLVAAAETHCRVILISTYYEDTCEMVKSVSPELAVVLQQLMELYAVYWTLERLNDLLLYTPISKQDVDILQARYEDLLCRIRPNAVGLVDAFDVRDEGLQSTLGAYDGRVYERLMEEALKSPLNAEPVNQSYHKYIKPIMKLGKL